MREIAAMAGGPISSVYQYFPNKSAILATLFEQWSDEMDVRVRERLDQVESVDGLMDAASELLDYFYSHVAEDPSTLDLLNAYYMGAKIADPGLFGAGIYIPALYVPLLLVSHVLAFMILSKGTSTEKTA